LKYFKQQQSVKPPKLVLKGATTACCYFSPAVLSIALLKIGLNFVDKYIPYCEQNKRIKTDFCY
jgi:hypothetical protein